jgi:mono/diheme cytochrome c family protein
MAKTIQNEQRAGFRMRRLLILAALTLLGANSPAVQAAERTGQEVYDKWCGICHDAGPMKAGTMALQDKYKGTKPAALLERTDLTPDVVKYFARHGFNYMPRFRKTEISDAELNALAEYVAQKSSVSGR